MTSWEIETFTIVWPFPSWPSTATEKKGLAVRRPGMKRKDKMGMERLRHQQENPKNRSIVSVSTLQELVSSTAEINSLAVVDGNCL